MAFVLASASPRRADLLAAAGFDFTIVPAEIDETALVDESPDRYVLRIARAKADRVRPEVLPASIILAADTVVVAGGRLLGKPADEADAASMLRLLSGATHEVHTAVVVQSGARTLDEISTTKVRFQPLTDEEIAWYVRSGEPFGKAGAYGIQGRAARFIDWIDGSWSNVVGLPISTVYGLMKAIEGDRRAVD